MIPKQEFSLLANGSNCDSLIENPSSDFQQQVQDWLLLKNAVLYLPGVVIAPFVAFLLDKLPAKFKFYPYFLTPVGVTISAIVLSIGYTRFSQPKEIVLSLIPIAATGGAVLLSLMAFAFVAYETVGKSSERLAMFVYLQVTFVAGKALGGILLALLESSVSNMGFCIISAALGAAGLAFVAAKTRIQIDDFELILAGLRNTTSFSIRASHTFLLFLCAVVYFLTIKSKLPHFGAVSYSFQTSGLLFFTIFIQIQLRKKIVQNKLLPKYEAPIIGLVGWGTTILAKLVYLIPHSQSWAPYVSAAVNSISQLGIVMTYYLLCSIHPKNPGMGLLWATVGGLIGSVPADFVFQKLTNATKWSEFAYLAQAIILLAPLLIFLYFYLYFKNGKGAPKKNFGDDENEAFFKRDLRRSYYGMETE